MKLLPLRLIVFFAAVLFSALAYSTVTEEDFLAKKTQNIINLCTASDQDPHQQAAIHFCHGYLVGAFHYYHAETTGSPEKARVCFPDPRPSRNEAIDMFITWAKQHPEYANEAPVDSEFRFLETTWPCK